MSDRVITADGSVAGIRAVIVPTRWRLWSEPPQYLVYWSISVAAAVALTVVTAVDAPPHSTDLIMFGVLAGLGVVQAEGSRQVERTRRIVDHTPHINLTSAWTFAGVLLLPPALTAALVALLYGHLARRCWRHLHATPTYRTVSNGCRATLCCYASYQVLTWSGVGDVHDAREHGWASVGGITGAIVIYFLIAAAIAIPGLKPADHTPTQLLGGWVDNILEVLTLLTAVAIAFLLVSPLPSLVFGLLAIVLLLVFAHHAVLDKQLARLGDIDDMTGLFNTRGWYRLAAEALTRAQGDHGTGAVLMIEIDRLADLSKGYSRLAGDAVLAAVADTVRHAVSDCDAVGRFTGPELFVVLLRDTTEPNAVRVAELIQTEVAWMRVPVLTVHGRTDVIRGMSVSIGVAAYPAKGVAIHKLLNAADTALEEARQLGHNRVRTA